MRATNRERIANHLTKMGFIVDSEKIQTAGGGKVLRLEDIIQSWGVWCKDENGNSVEITSLYTLGHCMKGFQLIKAGRSSQIYGHWHAVPLNEPIHKDEEIRPHPYPCIPTEFKKKFSVYKASIIEGPKCKITEAHIIVKKEKQFYIDQQIEFSLAGNKKPDWNYGEIWKIKDNELTVKKGFTLY